jgi:DNA invertase Pin-like site-specific DNA recombinase
VLHVFAALAGFERDHIRERTAAGLAAARARDVAVALLVTGGVQDRDLGALAVHVHADVHSHQGLLPRARQIPKPRLSG